MASSTPLEELIKILAEFAVNEYLREQKLHATIESEIAFHLVVEDEVIADVDDFPFGQECDDYLYNLVDAL